ncbi:hypothetical protein [Micromonospora sp. SH-82]
MTPQPGNPDTFPDPRRSGRITFDTDGAGHPVGATGTGSARISG